MIKNKLQTNVNNSSNEVRPELFNFNANKGKSVLIALKNDNIRTGMLLGICDNHTVLLELSTPQGQASISETPLFDVSEITVLDN
jgi:hypothetical protein